MARVAINGLGRIGRQFLRMSLERSEYEVVAVNDLGDLENLAYLMRYDTVFGPSPFTVETRPNMLVIDGKEIAFVQEREPTKLPWGAMNIDVVVEATGLFASYEKSKMHLTAGAKKVVISAPVKDDPAAANVTGATVLMGLNEESLGTCQISSNASCTTNAASPLIAILDETIGIEKAILSTVHAYTASQAIVDGPKGKDWREGRAAAQNIVPTSTGAAIAVTKAYTPLLNKFDGISLRVPVPVGSIADITFIAKRGTSADEVNRVLTEAAATPRWNKLFAVTTEPLVSSDIIGARFASIADLTMTRVVDGTLVKVLGWYDNESSYTHTLVEHVAAVARQV